MALMKRRFLFEAEDDDTNSSNTSGETTDTSDDTNTDNASTTNDTNSSSEDNSEDDNDTDDFSIDATPESDDTDDNSEENNDSDSSDNDNSTDDSSSDNSSEESEIDSAMFDTLDENEKRIKIASLKKSFIDLYSKSDVLVDKFNSIDEDDDEFNPVIKRIIKVLYEIKDYTSHYLLNIFDSKSYIENKVVFKRHLTALNGIKLIVQEMEKEKQNQDKN